MIPNGAIYAEKVGQKAYKPGSVPAVTDERWPFIWDARYRTPRATYPGDEFGNKTCRTNGVPPLFGLAPGGVCLATPVTGSAVRSYRTLSPLPQHPKVQRRFAFCGTFPEVTLAGRYPAPYPHGARTFLHGKANALPQRPSGHLTKSRLRNPRARRQPWCSTRTSSRHRVSKSRMPSTRAWRKWR